MKVFKDIKKNESNPLEEDISYICKPEKDTLVNSIRNYSQTSIFPHKEIKDDWESYIKIILSSHGTYLASIKYTLKVFIDTTHDRCNVFNTVSKNKLALITCFSQDEKLLATCGNKQTIDIIQTGTWVKIFSFPEKSKSIQCSCFSEKGDYLAYCLGNSKIKILEIEKKSIKYTIEGFHFYYACICFHPNGKYLALGAGNQSTLLLNIKNQEKLLEIKETMENVKFLTFSSDGKVLASILHNNLLIIAIISKKDGKFFYTKSISLYAEALCFVTDEKILTVGSAGFSVLDFSREKGLLKVTNKTFLLGCLKNAFFSHDRSILLTLRNDHSIFLFDLQELLKSFTIKTKENFCATLSDDSKFLAGASNNKVFIWDLENRSKNCILSSFDQEVLFFSFSDDSKLLGVITNPLTVQILDIFSGTSLVFSTSHPISSFVFSHNQKFIAAYSDKALTIFYLKESQRNKVSDYSFSEKLYLSCFSKNDNLLVVLKSEHSLKLNRIYNHFLEQSFMFSIDIPRNIEKIEVSRNGKYLAMKLSNLEIQKNRIFGPPNLQIASTKIEKIILKFELEVNLFAFSSCEQFLIYSLDDNDYRFVIYLRKLKNVQKSEDKYIIFDENLELYQLKQISSAGNLILLQSSPDLLIVQNLQDKIFDAELKFVKAKENLSRKESPCKQYHILKINTESILVTNSQETKSILSINLSIKSLNFVCFSHKTQLLAVAPVFRPVEIWNISTQQIEFCFGESIKKVYFLEFSKDDRFLVLGVLKTHIFIWNVLTKTSEIIILRSSHLIKGFTLFYPKILAVRFTRSTIKLWDLEKGTQSMKLKNISKAGSMIFTRNLKYLAVCCDYYKILIIKVENSQNQRREIIQMDNFEGSLRKIRKLE